MASGLLASLDITTTGSPQALYTPTTGKRGVGTLTLCNRTDTAIKVRVATTTGAAPTAEQWKVYDLPVNPVGSIPMMFSGIIVGNGNKLYVQAAAAGISATFDGVEEADV